MKDTILFLEMIGFVMGYVCAMGCLLGFIYWSATSTTLTEGIIVAASWWIFAETASKSRKKVAREEENAIEDIIKNCKH